MVRNIVRNIAKAVWRCVYCPCPEIDLGDGGEGEQGNLASTDASDWESARDNSTETQVGDAVLSTADDLNTFGASTAVILEAGKTYAVAFVITSVTNIIGSVFCRLSTDKELSSGNVFSAQDDLTFEDNTVTVPGNGTYYIGVIATVPGALASLVITVSISEVV